MPPPSHHYQTSPSPSPSPISQPATLPTPPPNHHHHQQSPKPITLLLAFDFDHTLIPLNSDLLPFQSPDTLPYGVTLFPQFAALTQQLGPGSWTRIMQLQLAALGRQEGYTRQGLVDCLRSVRMETGLVGVLSLLGKLSRRGGRGGSDARGGRGRGGVRDEDEGKMDGGRKQGEVAVGERAERFETVIASDANEVFIQEILDANGLADGVFGGIYTNRARWVQQPIIAEIPTADATSVPTTAESPPSTQPVHTEDILSVEPYQPPETPHSCPRCAANMCKSAILVQAKKDLGLDDDRDLDLKLDQDQTAETDKTAMTVRTVYIGDGGNDYCPALSLQPTDLLLVREGYALDKQLKRDEAAVAAAEDEGKEKEGEIALASAAAGDGSSRQRSSRPTQRGVIAEIRRWKTQEELGQLLLELIPDEGGRKKDAEEEDVSDGCREADAAAAAATARLERDFAKKAAL